MDRRLLSGLGNLSRLTLPDGQITRDRNDAWQWSGNTAVDTDHLQSLIDNWQTLSATSIRAFNLDASPGRLIEIQFDDGRKIDFLLQASEPEIILANPQIGLQYHYRRDYLNQLIAPGDG